MSAVILDFASSAVTRRIGRRGWFARVFAAVQASRMRSARATLARHRHLLPDDLERAGDRLDWRSEDQLPFARRD